MGLDQYLRAKTTKREYKGPTGACSGLFPIAPEDYDMVEIGYWRKAYDQDNLISSYRTRNNYSEDYGIRLSKKDCEEILASAKQILETHTFDEEDGYDITRYVNEEDNESGDFIDDGFELIIGGTWQSKFKWEETVKFFTEAINILNEDKDAEIYYLIWC